MQEKEFLNKVASNLKNNRTGERMQKKYTFSLVLKNGNNLDIELSAENSDQAHNKLYALPWVSAYAIKHCTLVKKIDAELVFKAIKVNRIGMNLSMGSQILIEKKAFGCIISNMRFAHSWHYRER